MLHHVELYVGDLQRSTAFWTPLMQALGWQVQPWSGGVNYLHRDHYLCFLPAPAEHLAAGYHRQRIGLNHLAFQAASRAQVDALRDWARAAGHTLLYEDRYPFAGGPGYYAMYCEDPDRIKVEVVAPDEGEAASRPPEHLELASGARLRRVALADTAALFAAADDAEVMRHLDWPRPTGPQDVAHHLAEAVRDWDAGREFQWVIVEGRDGAVVGTISCRPRGHEADFGYFLARGAWGRGLAFEAAVAVLAWLRSQPQILRIRATADVDNLRSRRLLERLGLELEGVMRRATRRPNLGGGPRDTTLYAWVREDARRAPE
ncbi:MAG: GNAT family N-acetyltransferase [Rubrivivax sp.]